MSTRVVVSEEELIADRAGDSRWPVDTDCAVSLYFTLIRTLVKLGYVYRTLGR